MDITQRLTGTPLARGADEIANAGLPAVELVPRPDLPPFQRVGESRFGGMPDLPSGVRWPRRGGRPLALLLQLDLRDVGGMPGTHVMPDGGTLWFFYDVVGRPWGYSRRERSGWRVLHAPAELPPQPARRDPAGLGDAQLLPAVVVACEPTVTFPSPLSHAAPRCVDDDDEMLYRQLVLGGDRIRHLLLGHADPIQCDPVGPGVVSLLQLDSDPLLGTMWGDSGKLHFTIAETALATASFEGVGFQLQCC